MPTIKHRSGLLFLILIFLVIFVTSVFLIIALQTDFISESLKNDPLVNTLFIITDADEILSTQIVLYYPDNKRAALFDIPGNTGAIFSSIGRVDRIDAIYAEKGLAAYAKEVQTLTGLKIPFTILVDIEQFARLTDYFNGLRVFIPRPIDSQDGDTRYLLPSGSVKLDGDKIQAFLRYNPEEDESSGLQEKRQDIFIAFLSALNENKEILENKKNYAVLEKEFSTNLSSKDLKKILLYLSEIDSERLNGQTVTGSVKTVDGKRLLLPFYDGQLIKDVCKQTINALVSSSNIVQSRVYVLEIQNGTTTDGLARNTSSLLQSVGYEVLSVTNAANKPIEETYIIDHIGYPEMAEEIGSFIRCTNVITEEIDLESSDLAEASLVDYTIVLGTDFDGRYVRR